MSDHTHYVPILKAMQGELGALEKLTPGNHSALTPLLEVPALKRDPETDEHEKTLDEHLLPVVKRIHKARGTQVTFLDPCCIPAGMRLEGGRQPVERLFAEARETGLRLVPVTGLARTAEHEAIARTAAIDGLGVCLRVRQDEFFDGHFAREGLRLVKRLGVAPPLVDLIVDLGSVREAPLALLRNALLGALGQLPEVESWRTLTLVSSAFPERLSEIRDFDHVPRLDWSLWSALGESLSRLPRMPAYGDYAIQSATEQQSSSFSGAANIRYTCDETWAIFRGRQLTRAGHEQFHALSESLVAQSFFSGAGFSWGDSYIANCAAQVDGPGNSSTWRKVGTCHHLTFVVRQLASAFGSSADGGPRRAGPRGA